MLANLDTVTEKISPRKPLQSTCNVHTISGTSGNAITDCIYCWNTSTLLLLIISRKFKDHSFEEKLSKLINWHYIMGGQKGQNWKKYPTYTLRSLQRTKQQPKNKFVNRKTKSNKGQNDKRTNFVFLLTNLFFGCCFVLCRLLNVYVGYCFNFWPFWPPHIIWPQHCTETTHIAWNLRTKCSL